MSERRLFTLGAILLLSRFVFSLLVDILLVGPALIGAGGYYWHSVYSNTIYYIFFSPVTATLISLGSVAGMLLLIRHYYRVKESETHRYRLLDRALALLFAVHVAATFLMLASLPAWVPGPHIGLARLLAYSRGLLQAGCALVWALGLWRARAGMALLFSVACVAFTFMPHIPINNPAFTAEIEAYGQRPGAGDSAGMFNHEDTAGISPAPPVVDAEVSPESYEDFYVVQEPTRGAVMPSRTFGWEFLLLTYTWLRWGRHAYKGAARLPDEASLSPGFKSGQCP